MTFVFLIMLSLIAFVIGLELFHKMPKKLHLPIISGCNALSGLVIIAAIQSLQTDQALTIRILTYAVIGLSTIHITCSFFITKHILLLSKK